MHSEYQIFKDYGYTQLANGGDFGDFWTCEDSPHYACDNIICSNNLKMINVHMHPDRELSDHRLMVADIAIL